MSQQRRDINRTTATAIAVAVVISIATVSLVFWPGARVVKTSEAETAEAKTEEAKTEEAKTEGVAFKHYLSFFADEQDAPILLARLNADPEIAFIVPDGPRMPPPKELMPPLPPTSGYAVFVSFADCPFDGYWQRWRVVRPAESLNDGEHILWHTAAGPLVGDDGPGTDPWPIPDAWAGWASKRPLCGPNILEPATVRLKLWARHAAYTPEEKATGRPLVSDWIDGDLLVASDFQWSGASLQPDLSGETARWATDLEGWFNRNAVQLRATDNTEVLWAFPSALRRLKAGLRYDARNYDFDDAIRNAP